MFRYAITRLLLAFAMLSIGAVAAAAPAAAPNARARLDAFAHGLHSLKGHFQQTLIDANGRRGRTSYGTVALEAPNLFRWQTTAPDKQLIVADGKHVWMYEPDLDQVTVRSQNTAAAHSPLTVITDVKRMDQDFNVSELGERDGLEWLRLTPKKPRANFHYAELGFDAHGLRAMRFKDQLDNITRMRFSDWRRNVKLPASTFTFTVPKGADVVGDVAPAASAAR
jgi:outer membrane lipoprotein carrier protein